MESERNFKGIPFVWSEYGKFDGIDINIIYKGVKRDSKGFDITGFSKFVSGDSKGVSITGGINYSKGVEDFLIQYGTLGNAIEKVNPDENFVLQIGLFNKIGLQYSPIVNFYGIKNIPKLIKKTFGKNKKILRE